MEVKEAQKAAIKRYHQQKKEQSGPSAASVFTRVHTGVLLPSRH